jgi:hypothetical protein
MYDHLNQTHQSSDSSYIPHHAPQPQTIYHPPVAPAALQLEPSASYTEAMRSVVGWNKALQIANWLSIITSLIFLLFELWELVEDLNPYGLIGLTFRGVGILVNVVGLKTAEKTDADSARCNLYWVSVYSGIVLLTFTAAIAYFVLALDAEGEPTNDDETYNRIFLYILLFGIIAAMIGTCIYSGTFIIIAYKAYTSRKALELLTSRPQHSEQVAYPAYVQGLPMELSAV